MSGAKIRISRMNDVRRALPLIAGLLALGTAGTLAVEGGEHQGLLRVKGIRRITHPNYHAVNQFVVNSMNPWSRDLKRMLLVEDWTHTDPNTGKKGRGFCWGYVDELTRWTTLDEYEDAAKPLPGKWSNFSLYWSPFEGEENMIYGVCRSPKVVARLNVDTGKIIPIVSCDPEDGTDIRKATALGWTEDNRLMVSFQDDYGSKGGYEIDIHKGARKRFNRCPRRPLYPEGTKDKEMAEFRRWPYRGHAHGAMSPSRKWYYAYRWKLENGKYGPPGVSSLVRNGLFLKDTGRGEAAGKYGRGIVSVSWKHSSDSWLLGVDLGKPYKPAEPKVSSYGFFQVLFNPDHTPHFRYNLLLEHKSATMWCNGKKTGADTIAPGSRWVVNYQALCKPVLRKDGKQFMFGSTGGKYSYEDHKLRGVEPWGFVGMYLVDLEPASGGQQ